MTESLIMEKPEAVAGTLRELRRLGVQIAIDDFGTGYSSLAYLQRFPIDTLKIDRSFVAPIGSKGERAEIARTIVDIGHNLGMSVIAEGVETADQLAQMRQLGCDGAQGYFIARPLHAVAAGELFASGQTW
jgi:EAL domain-containing protein (putative c-di-GMP-specific phosphodiesterase class I)